MYLRFVEASRLDADTEFGDRELVIKPRKYNSNAKVTVGGLIVYNDDGSERALVKIEISNSGKLSLSQTIVDTKPVIMPIQNERPLHG